VDSALGSLARTNQTLGTALAATATYSIRQAVCGDILNSLFARALLATQPIRARWGEMRLVLTRTADWIRDVARRNWRSPSSQTWNWGYWTSA